MKHVVFNPTGVCCSELEFDYEDNKIYNLKFTGGCPGNLTAISHICEGADKDYIISKFDGITCKTKPTSCTDQFAKCLKELD